MEVVLGPGWPGILLHEAIGHGLEADFNRKGISAFSGKMGQRVASDICTVVDDGTIPARRGSLNVDDEGEPTRLAGVTIGDNADSIDRTVSLKHRADLVFSRIKGQVPNINVFHRYLAAGRGPLHGSDVLPLTTVVGCYDLRLASRKLTQQKGKGSPCRPYVVS